MRDGKIIGSALLAQQFTGSNYFWPRPSACTYGTGGAGSGRRPAPATSARPAARCKPTSRTTPPPSSRATICPPTRRCPADMVFASGSGLDPHISPKPRACKSPASPPPARLSADKVTALVDKFTEDSQWGFLGEPRVNVLLLNIALDELAPKKSPSVPPPRDNPSLSICAFSASPESFDEVATQLRQKNQFAAHALSDSTFVQNSSGVREADGLVS